MAHLLILDALNLIRRLHAAQPLQRLSDEAALQGTRQGLLRTVQALLAQVQPSHVLAVFDGEQPSWRHACHPDYKAGRSPMPEALRQGLDSLQATLWELGIDSLLSDGDEADDLIATLSLQLCRRQQAVTLISTDRGFCQLLDSGLQIRDHFNRRWLDAAYVQQSVGVQPAQLVDYWALTGIGGANIKGVPGIGPKSARALLGDYGNLERLLADPNPGKAAARVQAHAAEAQLAQQLVRLREDIPLGFNLRDIRYPPA